MEQGKLCFTIYLTGGYVLEVSKVKHILIKEIHLNWLSFAKVAYIA